MPTRWLFLGLFLFGGETKDQRAQRASLRRLLDEFSWRFRVECQLVGCFGGFFFLEEEQRTSEPREPASGASQTNFRGDFVLNANSLVVLGGFFVFGGETKDQQAQRAFLGCLSDEFPW